MEPGSDQPHVSLAYQANQPNPFVKYSLIAYQVENGLYESWPLIMIGIW